MKMRRHSGSFLSKTKTDTNQTKPSVQKNILRSLTSIYAEIDKKHRRLLRSAFLSFAIDFLYTIYHGILGIAGASPWFISMFAFYGILAAMRFTAVLFSFRKHSCNAENFVIKLTGVLLALLSLVLSAVIYISQSRNIAAKHGEIIMITIAAYTFYKITVVIVRAVKQRGRRLGLLSVFMIISYAEAAASVLTLQRSMLVSFGNMDKSDIRLMNTLTGAAVCLFVLILGIYLMLKSKKARKN